jgi:hypothetical protein
MKTLCIAALCLFVFSILASCGGGSGGDTTAANKVVGTEVWVGSNDQGNTNTTLTKYENGTITTTGQWTYNYNGATVTCQITAGNTTVTGSNVTFTGTGTGTNPAAPAGYQTSPFTLSLTGTMSGGQGSGSFTISFQATNWPTSISGTWTAQKQSGSGVTNMPPMQTMVPSAPTGVAALPGNGQVSISWSAVAGATSYNIYWGTAPGLTKSNGTNITGVTTPYTHSGLTNGGTNYYLVSAVNSAGESYASMVVSAAPTGGSVPNIVSDTCKTPSAQGGCLSAVYMYSSGVISGITSYIYFKNIGGSGVIDATVTVGGFTENKQFAVDAGARYTLQSIVPAHTSPGVSSDKLYITASSPGFSETKTISAIYSTVVPAGFLKFVANGAPSSSLVVE